MIHFLIRFFLATFLLGSYSAYAWAGQWNIQLENDVTFYEDNNYTNGLSLSWQSSYKSNIPKSYIPNSDMQNHNSTKQDMPSFITWQQSLLFKQNMSHKDETNKNNWGLKLSQRMWTPNELKVGLPQPFDRPYAGVLELELHSASYQESFSQKNWLSFGVVGPAAGAEKLQSLFHSSTGSSDPKGWQYQIENQATFTYAYEADKLFYRSKPDSYQWEVSGYGYGSLSNLRSEINSGMLLRWGTNIANSFGRLSSHYGHVANVTELTNHYELILFSRIQLGYRFNDLTINGDLPYISNVEVQHLQARLDVGAELTLPHFSIRWSINTYTRDYQSDIDKWHGYGSLSISWAI